MAAPSAHFFQTPGALFLYGDFRPATTYEPVVMDIYQRLRDHFGPQGWWPSESRFETIVGAILTQAVTWKNAEKAIGALKQSQVFSAADLLTISLEELGRIITPALYHRQKARKLVVMMEFIQQQYGGDYDLMFYESLEVLRPKILSLWGIGPETADSILLYAGNYPIFVVDAYTRRIFSRLGLVAPNVDYAAMQSFLQSNTPADAGLYNEYHALLVALGARCCRTNRPYCAACPITFYCRH